MHRPHSLLSQKVPDLDLLIVVLNVGIDWEMRVHQAHFVSEAIGDTLEHVLHANLSQA